MLEADLTTTRKDLYAANLRTKSLASVLKDKSSKLHRLDQQLASQDDLLKVIPPALRPRGGCRGGGVCGPFTPFIYKSNSQYH